MKYPLLRAKTFVSRKCLAPTEIGKKLDYRFTLTETETNTEIDNIWLIYDLVEVFILHRLL